MQAPLRCKGKVFDIESHRNAKRMAARGLVSISYPDKFRVYCGFDIRYVIQNEPRDGQEKLGVCPKCGNTFTFRLC